MDDYIIETIDGKEYITGRRFNPSRPINPEIRAFTVIDERLISWQPHWTPFYADEPSDCWGAE